MTPTSIIGTILNDSEVSSSWVIYYYFIPNEYNDFEMTHTQMQFCEEKYIYICCSSMLNNKNIYWIILHWYLQFEEVDKISLH